MKVPSVESRKKRLKLAIKFVIIPLFIFFAIVYFGLSWYFSLFSKKEEPKSPSFVEMNEEKKEITDIPNVKPPKVIEKPTTVIPPKVVTPKPPTTAQKNWWEYPSKIYSVTKSGNDLLVLVNKTYKLSSSFVPSGLVLAETSGIRVKSKGAYYVSSILINDLKALNNAAKGSGIDVSIISAYRSYSTQKSTYDYWVKYNGGCVSCADKISARPGHSQHQLGTAVDFGSKENGDIVGSSFDNTKASKWLASNAYKYGFVISYPKGYESTTGYNYESWHYRYIGVENAKMMIDSGKILEVFLK
jgi:D-alanyl-D-alanine carboxypeptidase